MGIYFKDVYITLITNDNMIDENFEKYPVGRLKIAIRVRDFNEGRGGNNTKHKYSPSIKVISYGKGKSNNHSKDGDPIYFGLDDKGDISLKYKKSQFKNSKELTYLTNFIHHNYYHLKDYWYAPDIDDTKQNIENYQKKLVDRISDNINNNDYKLDCGVDDEISM